MNPRLTHFNYSWSCLLAGGTINVHLVLDLHSVRSCLEITVHTRIIDAMSGAHNGCHRCSFQMFVLAAPPGTGQVQASWLRMNKPTRPNVQISERAHRDALRNAPVALLPMAQHTRADSRLLVCMFWRCCGCAAKVAVWKPTRTTFRRHDTMRSRQAAGRGGSWYLKRLPPPGAAKRGFCMHNMHEVHPRAHRAPTAATQFAYSSKQ